MAKNLITKNILFGFLSWLIPFAVSFFLVKPGGEYIIPYATFKSIMMVAGTLSGCFLLFRYFILVQNDFIRNGVIVGLTWFAINIILDAVILIPFMKISFADYFMTIGLSYICIPIISIAMGYLLNRKIKHQ